MINLNVGLEFIFDMKNKIYEILVLVAIFAINIYSTAIYAKDTMDYEPVNYVNPYIGTLEKHGRGRTYPGVGMPFGMTKWTPDNTNATNHPPYEYGGATIPRFKNVEIMKGFRGSHYPNGSFMHDYGAINIMPTIGNVIVEPNKRGSKFSHEFESVAPHYYSVLLQDYNINVELTSTMRVGIFKIVYPKSNNANLIIDARENGGYVKVIPEKNRIVGYNANGGPYDRPHPIKGYFVIDFKKKFHRYGTWNGSKTFQKSNTVEGSHPGAYVSYKTEQNEQVLVKIATSFISIDKAKENMKKEIPDWDYTRVKSQLREVWNKKLGKIRVKGGTKEQKILFYTSLYNFYKLPRIMSEHGEYYSVFDGKIHKNEGYQWYGSDDGVWDTFRAKHPLLSLLNPVQEKEYIQSLLDMYKQGGWIPKWPNPGYSNIMIGTHADAIIASAFVRGIKDFDKELAFKAMYKNAMVSGDTLYEGRKGLKWYKKLGYVPSDKMGYYRKRLGGQATARTLEFAFDDFSIAQFAKGLGKIDEAEYFLKRSMNYRNVFDKKVGFVRGRNSDGSWTHIPFDPMKRHGPFTEATAWHYTWSVQHDIQGLINLIGGNRKFIKKLETALKGGKKTNYVAMPPRPDHQNLYFWFGNEPVHHAVYLFDYAGAPWKTQYWARDIMTRAFSVKPEGLPGDEDTGQMSAWYIFSSLGFYPTCPARPTYDIGSPVFEKVIINLSTNSDNGKKFIITAKNASNENIYIQSANLNGKKLDKPWITHKNIVSGGHLEFEMGPDPNKKWGSDAKNVPPSISEIKK